MEIDLEGNMVFQEVMNCVTHGLGILLATVGTLLLSSRVKGMAPYIKLSCAVFSTSLVVLYLSSTLYHSFFALQRTRYVTDLCRVLTSLVVLYLSFTLCAKVHFPGI